MNFLDYALHHLTCILRVLRGDVAALGDMDISADGFWRSFEAFPAALHYERTALSLPLFPDLRDSEQQRVIDAVLKTIDAAPTRTNGRA